MNAGCRCDPGSVLHRDLYLSDDERRDSMMACVSRGSGRVELEL